MRLLKMSLAVALMAGGCSYQTEVTLRNGETVESLYYHESRMPEEVMVEMWIDFAERRLRLKCSPHDAMGWQSRRFDCWLLDVVLSDREFGHIANSIRYAWIEHWENDIDRYQASTIDNTTCHVRMTTANGSVERFVAGVEPEGLENLRDVVRFAAAHDQCQYKKGERTPNRIWKMPYRR